MVIFNIMRIKLNQNKILLRALVCPSGFCLFIVFVLFCKFGKAFTSHFDIFLQYLDIKQKSFSDFNGIMRILMQIIQLHVSDEDSYHVKTGVKAKIKLLKSILQVKKDMELVARITLSLLW